MSIIHRVTGTGGNNGWERKKDLILFFTGIAAFVFVIGVMPILNYDFHFEYLIAALAVLGIPLARYGDKK